MARSTGRFAFTELAMGGDERVTLADFQKSTGNYKL
jgi:hypothetical protein